MPDREPQAHAQQQLGARVVGGLAARRVVPREGVPAALHPGLAEESSVAVGVRDDAPTTAPKDVVFDAAARRCPDSMLPGCLARPEAGVLQGEPHVAVAREAHADVERVGEPAARYVRRADGLARRRRDLPCRELQPEVDAQDERRARPLVHVTGRRGVDDGRRRWRRALRNLRWSRRVGRHRRRRRGAGRIRHAGDGLERDGERPRLPLLQHHGLLGAHVPRGEHEHLVRPRIELEGFPEERRGHRLAVDLELGSRHVGRLHLDDELGHPWLDLRELSPGLIDGGLERGRRARGQGRTHECPVGLRGRHEVAQRRVALGDAEDVGRRAEDLLRALELVERLGELPRALELVPLLEELPGRRALRLGDLRPRGRRPGQGRSGARDGQEEEKTSHGKRARERQ